MRYARIKDGVLAYFGVLSELGVLVAGVDPGNVVVTFVAPDLTTTMVAPAIPLAGKAGVYTALMPAAFLTTHGVGVYAGIVEISNDAPEVRDVKLELFRVGKRNDDDVFNVAQAGPHV